MAAGSEAAVTVRTTCPYCGVGCGVLATREPDGSVGISGDPDHPANRGRLCSKGSALAETLGPEGRLLHPRIGERRASWDEALDLVAGRFAEAVAEHGPDSVAFYVSGQFLTEDYYAANKLMKGFIGSGNIDTNSRLCMASAVAGHKRAFGADVVPGCYEDLEQADLLVLVGSNLAWCHPVLHQRVVAARARRPGMKLVAIDPRRTATAAQADLHLALAPDSDVALFNGLLDWLERADAVDANFVAGHTSGFSKALETARATGFLGACESTGIDPATLSAFYALFARSERTVTLFSQGVNQSVVGSDKVNAILNCHLATGRIGRPGSGPFSVTGQPNAMGGREVGGLANQLAGHMELDDPAHRDRVARFWGTAATASAPGLKAVDLFRAVGDGRIKALWIMATNPVDSLPEADRVRAALRACPFVVVSDVTAETDTAACAGVLLPSTAWGEKDGTVTNSERRISRQRAFLPPPGEARPDWWQIAEAARRLGHGAGFDYHRPAELFREHARLSGFENDGARAFDIAALGTLSDRDYDRLEPFQWGGERLYGDGRFHTADGRARLVPTPARRTSAIASPRFPLLLNSGRVRDQWHTMTRTGRSPRLSRHLAEPFVEVHPADATRYSLRPAELAVVSSERSHVVARVLVSEQQREGSLFVAMHWNDRYAGRARVGTLIGPAVDPLSGQPGLKLTAAAIAPFQAAAYGFAVTRECPRAAGSGYWARARTRGGWRLEAAWQNRERDWEAVARDLLLPAGDAGPGPRAGEGGGELLSYRDRSSDRYRFAAFDGGRFLGALFLSPDPVGVSRGWLADQLSEDLPDDAARLRLLAGRPGTGRPDPGAIICSCLDVGANQIATAVAEGCRSLGQVGARLGAGTNCGSCRSEIQGIIDHASRREAV